MNAWSDHMKSIDENLNILKKSHESIMPMEGKLTSMEYIINHLLTKVDMINEKFHDNSKPEVVKSQSVDSSNGKNDKVTEILNFLELQEKREKAERKEIINRLNAIQRQMSHIERNIYQQTTNNGHSGIQPKKSSYEILADSELSSVSIRKKKLRIFFL